VPVETPVQSGARTRWNRAVWTYDSLGRLTGGWLSNRLQATGSSPNFRFSYQVTGEAPVSVVTEELNADEVSYRASYQLFEG
jgi:hypothetical protein